MANLTYIYATDYRQPCIWFTVDFIGYRTGPLFADAKRVGIRRILFVNKYLFREKILEKKYFIW